MQKYTASTSGAFMEEFILQPYQSGSLNNLKFSVKDCIDIANKITGFGNPDWLKTHPPAVANAVCVELLLSQGAVCAGKTITDEFTYSLLGENFFYGTPVNPRYPDRVPGGSSSGSASSVACDIVDFALGTDTGGSVRVPASNCGLYGYRPTHGRISVAGVIPLAPSLDTVGILAKEKAVLKSVASVLLGINDESQKIQSKIIVISELLDACESNIRETILDYLNKNFKKYSIIKLSDIFSGIFSEEITLRWLFDLYGLIHSCEVWSVHGAWLESVKPDLGPMTNYNFNHIAKAANRKLLSEGVKKRERFAEKLQEYLSHNIILCFPTVLEIAPPKGLYIQKPEARTQGNYFQNLIGINAISGLSRSPQITMPISDRNNRPIGLSFLAGQYQDEILIGISQILDI